MTKNTAEISKFYDEYAAKQLRIGVNERHEKIVKFIVDQKLIDTNTKILEIGCGVGTVTQLLCPMNSKGRYHAIDISAESIEKATSCLSHHTHINFTVSDMSDFDEVGEYDLVVMADVIEHIPIELHVPLFKRLEASLRKEGTIVINIPDPDYLENERKNRPHLLQIIGQSIYSQGVLNFCNSSDLELVHLERYSIFALPFDYRRIVLKKKRCSYSFRDIQPTIVSRIKNKIKKTIRLVI
jgi:2-polyprenyl-3-methyl-5-hydroxy-6-metoxy-1,4-benzoquinol methylase